MKARSLIRWSALEEKRRKREKGGLGSLPELVTSALLGGVLAAEILRRFVMAEDSEKLEVALASSQLWIAAAVCGYAIVVFGAPFRLYWRSDSKLLASLPMPGSSLFALALWRSHRSAFQVSVALAIALVPTALLFDGALALRHGLAIAVGFIGAAWLGPAAALGAGAIVASDKAQAMLASMGGEFQAPRTSWLGVLPGLSATACAIGIIAVSPWIVGGRPPGGSIALIVVVAAGLSLASVAWAWLRAADVIPAAVREVAALDQEILAHVERSEASALESGFMSWFLRANAALVAAKDAALLRRRYPSPYFMIPCGIVAVWIVAASQPASYLPWAGAFFGAIMVYAYLMAKRAQSAPVELPALIATLAISPKDVSAAKNRMAILRIGFIAIVAGIPMVLRAPDPLSTAIFVVLSTALIALGSRRG